MFCYSVNPNKANYKTCEKKKESKMSQYPQVPYHRQQEILSSPKSKTKN